MIASNQERLEGSFTRWNVQIRAYSLPRQGFPAQFVRYLDQENQSNNNNRRVVRWGGDLSLQAISVAQQKYSSLYLVGKKSHLVEKCLEY